MLVLIYILFYGDQNLSKTVNVTPPQFILTLLIFGFDLGIRYVYGNYLLSSCHSLLSKKLHRAIDSTLKMGNLQWESESCIQLLHFPHPKYSNQPQNIGRALKIRVNVGNMIIPQVRQTSLV